jgi:hypothetical protein
VTRERLSSPFVVIGLVVEAMQAADAAARLAQLSDSLAEPHRIVPVFDDDGTAGVELLLGGELLGMPTWIELDHADQNVRDEQRVHLRTFFTIACEVLTPLYGGVDIEWELPGPQALPHGRARLPGDCYWSTALDTVDRQLATDLAHVFSRQGRPIAHGTLIEAGGLLDPTAPRLDTPLAASRAAARRLAETLRRR